MIIVIADVYLQEGKEQDFLVCAKKCVEATLKEEGNIEYNLTANAFEKNKFTFVEKWESKEALDLHMKTEHFAEFGKGISGIVVKAPVISLFDAVQVN